MLRQLIASGALSATQHSATGSQLSRQISSQSKPNDQGKDAGTSATARWLAALNSNPELIPSRMTAFTFSRASGPGGQKVNKYEKAPALKTHTR